MRPRMYVVTRQNWSNQVKSESTLQPIAGTAGGGPSHTWPAEHAIPEEREVYQHAHAHVDVMYERKSTTLNFYLLSLAPAKNNDPSRDDDCRKK